MLVCNAAYQMTHDQLGDFPTEQIERTFATNVFGPFWLIQALAPELEDGGSVLVTTSVQAYSPSDHLLDYAATKAALNNLVVNLAQELGAKGTRVNAVAPGPIWTPLIPATMGSDKVEGFGADTPLGRPGQPVEVAAAYVFLASDEASYVSGTVLGVTGGKPGLLRTGPGTRRSALSKLLCSQSPAGREVVAGFEIVRWRSNPSSPQRHLVRQWRHLLSGRTRTWLPR